MTRRYVFLCVGNSCRSQMAEGFARHLIRQHGLDIEVRSGGTRPASRVDPTAIAVMAEVGVDIGDGHPQPLDLGFAERSDRIITMGCRAEDACPAHILPKVHDWGLEDPVGREVAFFRTTRDEIERRVHDLFGLAPPASRAHRLGKP